MYIYIYIYVFLYITYIYIIIYYNYHNIYIYKKIYIILYIYDIHLVPRMGCDPKNGYHVQNPTKVDEEKIHRSAFNNHVWYPLVNIQKAIENGHRNSGFTH